MIRSLSTVGLCLVFLLAVAGERTPTGLRDLKATFLWSNEVGYQGVQVDLDLAAAGEIEVMVKGGDSGLQDRWSAPVGRSRRTVLLPVTQDYFYETVLTWTFAGRSGRVEVEGSHGYSNPSAVLLLSRDHDLETRLDDVLRTTRYSLHGYGERLETEPFPPDRMPDRWQALPPSSAILLARDGLAGMDEGQRRALLTWRRQGGVLVALDAEVESFFAANGCPVAEGFGYDTRPTLPELATYLQRCMNVLNTRPLPANVPGTGAVPANLFITIAIFFILLVGPGGVLLAILTGRRWLLLVLTPVVSATFCLGLVVFSFLAEGFAVKGHANQLVVYDQANHLAAAWTAVDYFATFGISDITLEAEDGISSYNFDLMDEEATGAGAITVDWREGQVTTGTWVPNRVERRLLYAHTRPLRDRLTVVTDGAGFALVNGLPVTVNQFEWFDVQARRWQVTRAVEPGATARLVQRPGRLSEPMTGLGSAARLQWFEYDDAECFRARCAGPLLPLPGPAFAEQADAVCQWLLAGRLPAVQETGDGR